MDIPRLLIDLRAQRHQLEEAIAALEELQAESPSTAKRRGRKFMDEKERLEVSLRMKRYWASRRVARQSTRG